MGKRLPRAGIARASGRKSCYALLPIGFTPSRACTRLFTNWRMAYVGVDGRTGQDIYRVPLEYRDVYTVMSALGKYGITIAYNVTGQGIVGTVGIHGCGSGDKVARRADGRVAVRLAYEDDKRIGKLHARGAYYTRAIARIREAWDNGLIADRHAGRCAMITDRLSAEVANIVKIDLVAKKPLPNVVKTKPTGRWYGERSIDGLERNPNEITVIVSPDDMPVAMPFEAVRTIAIVGYNAICPYEIMEDGLGI